MQITGSRNTLPMRDTALLLRSGIRVDAPVDHGSLP